MKVLLLGGTGAMGIELARVLEQQGEYVDVTSRKTRNSISNRISFLQGDAHDTNFLKTVLASKQYDAIVDFMVYSTEEFQTRLPLLLNTTQQYVFLSSARVYAQSAHPLTEDSPRLLDVCKDPGYLATDEYALTKARQEDCIQKSDRKNWTIIRPYVTYNNERLQLGVLEKELWLNRAIQGKTIVFSKDIADRITTLTHGRDVATVIAKLIQNPKAYGEIFHITGQDTLRWSEILAIYVSTLEKVLGQKPKVRLEENAEAFAKILCNSYQIKYDRLFDRVFDSKKVNEACDYSIDYIDIHKGLEQCLKTFLSGERRVQSIDARWEAYADVLSNETTHLKSFKTSKQKVKYCAFRFLYILHTWKTRIYQKKVQ